MELCHLALIFLLPIYNFVSGCVHSPPRYLVRLAAESLLSDFSKLVGGVVDSTFFFTFTALR